LELRYQTGPSSNGTANALADAARPIAEHLFPHAIMVLKFTPDEEAEIELLLWEYDRDGKIAIENFFRREPELSLRMAGGIIPKRIRRDLIAFLKTLKRR